MCSNLTFKQQLGIIVTLELMSKYSADHINSEWFAETMWRIANRIVDKENPEVK